MRKALSAAFPHTVPILAGFLFLGIAYGLFMKSLGFPAIYPILMSMSIFAGSMEFVAAGFLFGPFEPLRALLLTLMINARHLFYGLSMLEKYSGVGWKKAWLIFGMCDESFAINLTAEIPPGVDRGWFLFFVTLLNYSYWVCGATAGALAGTLADLRIEGLDFVMTALFLVLFLERWLGEKTHRSSLLGLTASAACLFVFGGEHFIIPAMTLILAVLTLLRPVPDAAEAARPAGEER